MGRQVRIIVRPWVPRRIPYSIPAKAVEEKLTLAYPKLKRVLYIGWIRKKVNGKSGLFYLAATADTTKDARRVLKKSESFGEDIWNLGED